MRRKRCARWPGLLGGSVGPCRGVAAGRCGGSSSSSSSSPMAGRPAALGRARLAHPSPAPPRLDLDPAHPHSTRPTPPSPPAARSARRPSAGGGPWARTSRTPTTTTPRSPATTRVRRPASRPAGGLGRLGWRSAAQAGQRRCCCSPHARRWPHPRPAPLAPPLPRAQAARASCPRAWRTTRFSSGRRTPLPTPSSRCLAGWLPGRRRLADACMQGTARPLRAPGRRPPAQPCWPAYHAHPPAHPTLLACLPRPPARPPAVGRSRHRRRRGGRGGGRRARRQARQAGRCRGRRRREEGQEGAQGGGRGGPGRRQAG